MDGLIGYRQIADSAQTLSHSVSVKQHYAMRALWITLCACLMHSDAIRESVSSAMRPTWAMEQIAPVGRSPWRTTHAAVWFAVRVLASASPHWRENVTASGSGPTAPSALVDGTMAFHAERCLACICLFVDKFRLFFLHLLASFVQLIHGLHSSMCSLWVDVFCDAHLGHS